MIPSRKKTILMLLPLLFIIVIAFVVYDLANSRAELRQLLEGEAKSIGLAIENAVRYNQASSEEFENFLLEKLFSSAYLVAHLEEHSEQGDLTLRKLSEELDVDLVMIYSSESQIHSNIQIDTPLSETLRKALNPILSNEYEWLETGYVAVQHANYYTVTHSRLKSDGAVVCGIKDSKLLEFRKKFGLGALLKQFTDSRNVGYIIIQDTIGIYAGAGEFIAKDKLINSTNYGITSYPHSEIIKTDSTTIYELISKIDLGDSSYITIGLPADKGASIQQKAVVRGVILIAGLILLNIGVIVLFNQSSKIDDLKTENLKFRMHLSAILKSLNDAIIGIDIDGKIELINPSAIKLLNIDDSAINNPYSEIFKDDEFGAIKALRDKTGVHYAEAQIVNNGEAQYLAYSSSFLINMQGEEELLIIVIKDITLLKQSQEIAQRRNRLDAMANLAAGVAHEIRNPLNSISMIVQRFKLEFVPLSGADEYAGLVDIVRSEISRLNNIITQFLDYAKPKPLQLEPVDLCRIVDGILNLMQSKLSSNGISLNKKYGDNCILQADENRIKQVLINLIQNSIDELSRGGTITVGCSKISNRIIFELADTGRGIPDENKEKIFNLYYSDKPNGSGIGLSIVQQVIDEHKGKIQILDNQPNGTIFRIDLPV